MLSNTDLTSSVLLETIIDNTGLQILVLDHNFQVVSLNPSLHWVLFESFKIKLKKGDYLFELPELKNNARARIWKDCCIKSLEGHNQKIEEYVILKGSKLFWEIHFTLIVVDGVKLVAIFARNITSRKQIEYEILKKEANLRAIIDSLNKSVLLIDDNFKLIDFNILAAQSFQVSYNTKLEVGGLFFDFLPKQMIKEWKLRLSQVLFSSPTTCMYVDNHLVCNQTIICETIITPVLEKEKIIGVTICTEDITQRKVAEQQLNEHLNELKIINNELDQFVYSASHDLRAPLLSLKGLINIMRLSPDNLLHFLDRMENSVDRLDSYVANIIHYSMTNRLEPVYETILFEHLISETFNQLQYHHNFKKVNFIKKIEKLSAHPFFSDFNRLQIIFKNLFANSFTFIDNEKPINWLKLNVKITQTKARIEVSDNGIGIEDEYLNKIYLMFFRASEYSTGSGLGLYIVKNAVEKLDGTIQCQTKFKKGTKFVISIPNRN